MVPFQVPFPLAAFVGKQMSFVSFFALDLATGQRLHALFSSAMRFELHEFSPFTKKATGQSRTCKPASAFNEAPKYP
jgi:hypothetical protein